MRRCVGAAAVAATSSVHPGWRGNVPAMGGLAVWNSMYFHSSSKFIGRKTGGSKKLGDVLSSSGTSAGGTSTGAGGGDAAAAAEERSTTNNTTTSSSSCTGGAAASRDADGRKKQRDRYARKSVRNSNERTAAASSRGKENTQLRRESTGGSVGGKRAVAAAAAVAAVATADSAHDEATLMAERASITKLFMVSDSVASIFCALPQDQRSIDNYLKEVDRAVVPSAADGNAVDGEEAARYQAASTAMREIAQRVLSEERADHSLCIHVRNMEQLVPPPHLMLDADNNNNTNTNNTTTTSSATGVVSTDASKKKTAENTRRRVPSKRGSKTTTPPPIVTPTVSEKSMTLVERVMALKKWQEEAAKKARESQERYKIPDDYHTITRVRFHDPHKADLTVVQGCGGSKSVVDVLSAMNRNMKHQSSDGAEKNISSGNTSNNKESKESAAALLSTPFALKPLLSVVASCIPRRESSLGSRCGEEVFFSSPAYTSTRRLKRQECGDTPNTDFNSSMGMSSSSSSSSSSLSSSSSFSRMREEELLARRLPPMPRYTTRVTVLVEHDELQPVDLLSMAERSTTRREERGKSSTSSSTATTTKIGGNGKKKKKCHIYCLIADGGEF